MPDGSRATLQDVADAAGVSRATASFALTGKGRVSAATRSRVSAEARRLGYRANLQARNFRASRTGSIGLYLPQSAGSLSFYMDFTFGVVDAARAAELTVTLLPAGDMDPATSLDGVIIVDAEDGDPGAVRLSRQFGIVVAAEGLPANLPAPSVAVCSDHEAATAEVLQHLADNRARRIGLIRPPLTTDWVRRIEAQYQHWSRQRGQPAEVVEVDRLSDAAQIIEAVTTLVRHRGVDALLVVPDGAALIAARALRHAEMTPGRDVLLASYSDSPVLSLTDPPITAVDLAARDLGRRSGQAAADLLRGRALEPVPALLPLVLRRRLSTRR